MSIFENVIIAGGAGNVGEAVVAALKDTDIFVTILARSGSTTKLPEGYPIIKADYDSKDSLIAAFKGQDAVVSLVGFEGFDKQKGMIDAAIAAGVKRFIPSEFGGDVALPGFREIGLLQNKIETQEYLKVNAEKGEIEYTIFVTGLFFDWVLKRGSLGYDLAHREVRTFGSGNQKLSVTNLTTIGKLVAYTLTHPSVGKNATIKSASYVFTLNEILAELEKQTREKWEVEHADIDEAFKGGIKLRDAGEVLKGFYHLLPAILFNESNKYNTHHKANIDVVALGLESETFEDVIKRALP